MNKNKTLAKDDSELVSAKLKRWLKTDSTPTLQEFNQTFSHEGMGLIVMLLMSVSALPIPTGGLTNILEPTALIISFQMLIGRKSLWLPKKMQSIRIGNAMKTKVMPKLIQFIEKAEKISSSKFKPENLRSVEIIMSILMIIFIIGAFFAPPFSMLDTLPSMGAVLLALSLVNHNKKIFLIGALLGLAGMILEIFFSAAVISLIKNIGSKINL